MRVRILDRLLVQSFLRIFLAVTLGSPLLFILADLTENLEGYLDQELAGFAIAQAYFYMLPQFIQWAFPVGGLVAVVFTIQTMTLHREILAAKAGGISFHRLIVPLFLLGSFLTVVALGLSAIVPRANSIASRILEEEESRRDFRGNFSYQAEGGRNFNVQSLSVSAGTLNEVVVQTVELGSNRPMDHLTARVVRYDPESGWTFSDGYYRMFLEDGSELAFEYQTLQTRGFTERPEDFLEEPKDPEEMTYQEMGRLADIMERSGNQPHKLRVDRQEKLAIPVATLVIILFGAPLATSTKRGGTAYGIGVALISTILYMLLFRISGAFGETGSLDPMLAAWLPNLLFLGAGLAFLTRVRT
jgi:lipopolysaccharide export system permease protein